MNSELLRQKYNGLFADSENKSRNVPDALALLELRGVVGDLVIWCEEHEGGQQSIPTGDGDTSEFRVEIEARGCNYDGSSFVCAKPYFYDIEARSGVDAVRAALGLWQTDERAEYEQDYPNSDELQFNVTVKRS